MRFTSGNNQSKSRVSLRFSSTDTFQILYDFEHNGFNYLLTLQPPMGNKTLVKSVKLETRLVRFRTTDSLLDSYIEISLVCKIIEKQSTTNKLFNKLEKFFDSTEPTIIYHRQAVAATFAKDASALFRKHRFGKSRYVLEEKQDAPQKGSLYVSFRSNETLSAKLDNQNPLCHFDMSDVEKTFYFASMCCYDNIVDVQLLETVRGREGLFKCESIIGHIDKKELVCGHVGSYKNKFILEWQTPPGKHVFSLVNGNYTSFVLLFYSVLNKSLLKYFFRCYNLNWSGDLPN